MTHDQRRFLEELAAEIRESNDIDVRLEDADAIDAALAALAEKDAQIAALREWVEKAIQRSAQKAKEAIEKDDQEQGMTALGALGALQFVAKHLSTERGQRHAQPLEAAPDVVYVRRRRSK